MVAGSMVAPSDARLPLGHGVDHADREAAGELAGELGGAEDRGGRRRAGIAELIGELWRAPDPPRVEELLRCCS